MLAVLKRLTRGRRAAARAASTPRRVWRITDSKPEGGWVDVDSRPAPASEIDERTTLPMDSWATSSMDLREGMHIVELDDPPSGPTIAP
ncbi:hypothetical protein [Piscinibacter sp.]|uniref:hypothetical protein n=1 Tax=Piscinibacter sp. TaxID=1903157 RepID=UPI0035B1F35D